MKVHELLSSVSLLAVFSMAAHADALAVDKNARLKLGINVGYIADTYNADNAISVLPQAFYDNHRIYIEGAEAGIYPYKDSQHHLRMGVTYDGRSFDNERAHTNTLKQLDERKWSALAHASYMYVSPIGGFKAKLSTDLLNRHSGKTASLAHLSKFDINKFTLYPSFGVVWHDADYNDYYYGVSHDESIRSGLSVYQPSASVSPFASVMVNYDVNKNLDVFMSQRLEWLGKAQKQSPLNDSSLYSSTRLGVNYKF